MFDFEIGAKGCVYNSIHFELFRFVFTNSKANGCLFHFSQNLMRKLCKIGLKMIYIYNKELQHRIKRIFTLFMTLIDKVDTIFRNILDATPEIPLILFELLDYFVNTYFECRFPIQIWNNLDTIGEPWTNNHLEDYNLKLKKCVIVAHPDILKAIHILQDQEVEASLNYYKALNGERISPLNKKEIEKDGKLSTFKEMYLATDIKLDVYVKKIIEILYIGTEKKKDNEESSDDELFSEEEDEVDSDDSQDSQSSQDTYPEEEELYANS